MRRLALVLAASILWIGMDCHGAARPGMPRSGSSRPFRRATTPNFVLIVADDLGYGDLGCYGQAKIRTPNMDRIAREGMLFTQAYAGNTVCAPSRCALMTGKHSGHGRIRSNIQVPLEPGDITIAEVLRVKQYFNCATGKWALGWENTTGHPQQQGFHEWFGFLEQRDAHNYYPPRLWRNADEWPLQGNAGGARRDYAPDWFVKVATNFVRTSGDLPFFLYYAPTMPHANNERGTNGMEVPTLGPYRKENWPAPEKAKASMISRLDDDIGLLMTQIQREGLDNDTIVIITSDNGPHREGGVDPAFFRSSGPFRGIKRDLYEGGIRIPFLVRWPGHVKAGTTNQLPIAFWDILPTLAELAGIDPPRDIDGISFAKSLLGRPDQRTHQYFYWEFHEKVESRAVRRGDWKGVKPGADKPLELYDLAADPGETKDLARSHPEVVRELEDIMASAADPFDKPVDRAPKPPWALTARP